MAPKVEIIQEEKLRLGEGPHWDHEAQALYYVDILESTVFKYDPSTKKITRVIVDKKTKTPVGWVIPVAGSKDKFAIAYGRTIAVLTWDGISLEPTNLEIIVEVDHGTDHRFNDGKADPKGRLWSGTITEFNPDLPEQRNGTLYSLNNDRKTVRAHFGNVGISNGLAWPADHKTMYYIDSYNRAIWAFDYDIDNGDISNQRVAFDLQKNNIDGYPDGMTIDKDDKLWMAVFGRGGVYQIDPKSGAVLQFVEIPALWTTSCVWGGPNLDELYVTSASAWDKEGLPNAGRTFRVIGLGTSGLPGASAKL